MPVAKVVTAQSNFSGGEADIWIKRADQLPLQKAAGRQMRNWRVLNSGAPTNRPGRTVIGLPGQTTATRTDEVYLAPGQLFYLVFGFINGSGYLQVWNAAFSQVFGVSGLPAPPLPKIAEVPKVCELKLKLKLSVEMSAT